MTRPSWRRIASRFPSASPQSPGHERPVGLKTACVRQPFVNHAGQIQQRVGTNRLDNPAGQMELLQLAAIARQHGHVELVTIRGHLTIHAHRYLDRSAAYVFTDQRLHTGLQRQERLARAASA